MYRIVLVNKKTKETITFNDVVDVNNGEKLFYKFQINTSQMVDGEYTLSLYEDDALVLVDTLVVGEFNVNGLQYNRGEDIYIETNLNCITEVKRVTLTEQETVIYPSEGVDAMTEVIVDATELYATAYEEGSEEGFNEGVEEGIAQQKMRMTRTTITENGVYANEDGYNEVTVAVEDVGGANVIEVTQAEFDALGEYEESFYIITDGQPSFYTKNEVDNKLNNHYLKNEVDNKFNNYYTIADIDAMIGDIDGKITEIKELI